MLQLLSTSIILMFDVKVHSQSEVEAGPFCPAPPSNSELTVFSPEVYDPALDISCRSSGFLLFPAYGLDFRAALTMIYE